MSGFPLPVVCSLLVFLSYSSVGGDQLHAITVRVTAKESIAPRFAAGHGNAGLLQARLEFIQSFNGKGEMSIATDVLRPRGTCIGVGQFQQVQLAIADRKPGAGEVQRRPFDLIESQQFAVKAERPFGIVNQQADVVYRLNLHRVYQEYLPLTAKQPLWP